MVSVIVPVYNVEEYIGECLNSIIKQTYKDIEILCIDDCGLDNSITIIKEFMKIDERIRIINHKQNKGLGGARNTGIDHAKGEYIVFIDSDDIIHPSMIEELYNNLLSNNVDASVCGIRRFTDEKELSYESTFHYAPKMKSRVIDIKNSKERIIDIWPSACNKMFKTDIIKKYNCHFPEKLLYEDHQFYYNYFSNIDSFYYINEPFYNYRAAREGSITTTSMGREEEIYKVLSNIKPIFEKTFNEKIFRKAYAKIYFRLLWERQFVLYDMKTWISYCENARQKLFELFDYDTLISSIDKHISYEDPFYKYIFYTGLKRKAYIIKRKFKDNKFAIKLYDLYKKIRWYRTNRSYIKELIWVAYDTRNKIL